MDNVNVNKTYVPKKLKSIIGLAPAPDFPKVLVWDKMSMIGKKATCL